MFAIALIILVVMGGGIASSRRIVEFNAARFGWTNVALHHDQDLGNEQQQQQRDADNKTYSRNHEELHIRIILDKVYNGNSDETENIEGKTGFSHE